MVAACSTDGAMPVPSIMMSMTVKAPATRRPKASTTEIAVATPTTIFAPNLSASEPPGMDTNTPASSGASSRAEN